MPKAYCTARCSRRLQKKKAEETQGGEANAMQVGTHFTEEVSLCRSLFETFFFVGIGRRRIGHWGSLLSNCYQAASYASKTRQS
jgi:hypothetical protein